jgi:hypothetical protein
VLLAGLPALLGAIVRDAVARAPDVRIVGELPSLDALDALVARALVAAAARRAAGGDPLPDAQVVIVPVGAEAPAGAPDAPGAAAPVPDAVSRLLYAHAHLAVLGIAPHDGSARLWRLAPHATPLGDRTADELLALLRDATRPAPPAPRA